jgi:hypothetical protein
MPTAPSLFLLLADDCHRIDGERNPVDYLLHGLPAS